MGTLFEEENVGYSKVKKGDKTKMKRNLKTLASTVAANMK